MDEEGSVDRFTFFFFLSLPDILRVAPLDEWMDGWMDWRLMHDMYERGEMIWVGSSESKTLIA